MRAQQDDLLRLSSQKKPKSAVAELEFERVSDFAVGDRVIFLSKTLNGKIDTTDLYALYVVSVTKVPFAEPEGKGKDEDMEEDKMVQFSHMQSGELKEDEAVATQFYQLPPGPKEKLYGARHLVLFQRESCDEMDALLEVGWLYAAYRTSSGNLVELDSFDGVADAPEENVLFDVFPGKYHVNDVEFKAALLEIEFADNRTSKPEDA